MKLIIGLGNPGKKYEKTRHNVGWLAIDYIRDNIEGFSNWKKDKKSNSLIAALKNNNGTMEQWNNELILAKPQAFMNNSGLAVKSLVTRYLPRRQAGKLLVTNLIIIHDDIDLPFGKFKIQSNRGPAGHNGVKSIIEHLGTKDFTRVRIGILPPTQPPSLRVQRPPAGEAGSNLKLDTTNYVLKNLTKKELDLLKKDIFPEISTKL